MSPQHYSNSEPETSGDDGASIDFFGDSRSIASGNRGISIPVSRISDVTPAMKHPQAPVPRFDETINYDRMSHEKGSKCLMCGGRDVLIPKQNKDVCRVCDSCVWLHRPTRQHLKWCKGCKRFNSLGAFKDKPEATKCAKCRERGRRGYEKRRRRLSVDVDSDTEVESLRKDSISSELSSAEPAAPRPKPVVSHMPPEPLVKHAASILLMIKSNIEEAMYDADRAELKRKRAHELPPAARKRSYRETGFTSADLPIMQTMRMAQVPETA